MKKKLFSILLAFSFVFVLAFSASAAGTGYITAGGGFPQGQFYQDPAYKCYTSADTARGENTFTYFDSYKSLDSSYYYPDMNREFTFLLCEDDFWSFDDIVKTYTGSFYEYALYEFHLDETNISGDIESSGDDCAELFAKYTMSAHLEDSVGTFPSGMFRYNIGIN